MKSKDRRHSGRKENNLIYDDELGYRIIQYDIQWDDWNDYRDGFRDFPKTKREKKKIKIHQKRRKAKKLCGKD